MKEILVNDQLIYCLTQYEYKKDYNIFFNTVEVEVLSDTGESVADPGFVKVFFSRKIPGTTPISGNKSSAFPAFPSL